jgi:hypothetical protein
LVGVLLTPWLPLHHPCRSPSQFLAPHLQEAGLKVKEYELLRRNFSDSGNFGFGINEHIDLGIKYDPSTGIYGERAWASQGILGYLMVF